MPRPRESRTLGWWQERDPFAILQRFAFFDHRDPQAAVLSVDVSRPITGPLHRHHELQLYDSGGQPFNAAAATGLSLICRNRFGQPVDPQLLVPAWFDQASGVVQVTEYLQALPLAGSTYTFTLAVAFATGTRVFGDALLRLIP